MNRSEIFWILPLAKIGEELKRSQLVCKFYDEKQVIKQAYGFWVGWINRNYLAKTGPREIGGHSDLRNL